MCDPAAPIVIRTLAENGTGGSCMVSPPKITLLVYVQVLDNLKLILVALFLDTSPYKMIDH